MEEDDGFIQVPDENTLNLNTKWLIRTTERQLENILYHEPCLITVGYEPYLILRITVGYELYLISRITVGYELYLISRITVGYEICCISRITWWALIPAVSQGSQWAMLDI